MKFFLPILLGLLPFSAKAAQISFPELGPLRYGVQYSDAGQSFSQNEPLAIEIVDASGQAQWITASYQSIQVRDAQLFVAQGSLLTPGGSSFAFTDEYRVLSNDRVAVTRRVRVERAGADDRGFSSRLSFQDQEPRPMQDYEFFVPAVWYKDNADVPDFALATDYSDQHYWFREDRLPLPIFMIRRKENGFTFAVFHSNQDGATFKGEDGLNRVIDARMKFGSMGMDNNRRPAVGFLYPGTEGERTGIFGMSPQRRWALRSHPVNPGFEQSYQLVLRIAWEWNYTDALKSTWGTFLGMQNPKTYAVDLRKIYQDQVNLLNRYWQEVNGAPGVPFRIQLDGKIPATDALNLNMGFVGQQIANASLLIREGYARRDQALRERGERMVEWWVRESLDSKGCPRTWYDPKPRTWRSYETYQRVIGDGMSGLLWAWRFEKQQGQDKAHWLAMARRVASWLKTLQNADGSFPRAYDCVNARVSHADKTNSSHIVPFLVELYQITRDPALKPMIDRVATYIEQDIYRNFRYIGGTPDNPNVPDKEAASMALRAFMALYEMEQNPTWLQAALQTAYYYQTWIYAWNVPIPQDDAGAIFPRSRQTTGLSVIATGNNAADSYAAIDAFLFYRLHLLSNDYSLLQTYRLLLYNSKQYVNWDPHQPLPGFGDPGILGEALSVMTPRGHGVKMYLPWQAFNLVAPLIQMEETYGRFDID